MARKYLIVGIDVGTTQVRVIVGEPRPDGTVSIVGLGLSPSDGLKKGVIVDLDKTVESIETAVAEAERMAGQGIDAAFVGLKGLNVELVNNRGVVAVSSDDREIREEDAERALQAARVMALPPDREIVDIIPREYIVDGYDGIRDPVGMLGVRLEVDAMIVTSPITSLRNLIRCINRAGINVNGMILHALASSEITLSADEKDLGVFLVNLGGGTTEISLYQHGKLRQLSVIPIGGEHITSDLALGLRTSHLAAENLKLEHGYALLTLARSEPHLEISSVGSKERRLVSEKDLCRFIEPRVQEIFQITREEMLKMGWSKLPPAGVVLCGGVSAMPGVLDLARLYFESDAVRLAAYEYIGIQNPIYTTAVGLLYYAHRYQPRFYLSERGKRPQKRKTGLWQKMKDWMNEVIE
ncbi:MAG: cell division protein FtsA [Bacillota bacterium]